MGIARSKEQVKQAKKAAAAAARKAQSEGKPSPVNILIEHVNDNGWVEGRVEAGGWGPVVLEGIFKEGRLQGMRIVEKGPGYYQPCSHLYSAERSQCLFDSFEATWAAWCEIAETEQIQENEAASKIREERNAAYRAVLAADSVEALEAANAELGARLREEEK